MGWLNRLFGGGKETTRRDRPESNRTQKAVSLAQSGNRAMEIPSAQFEAVSRQKTLDKKDTGPWFIGKTVGEIYQIRGVLGRGGEGTHRHLHDPEHGLKQGSRDCHRAGRVWARQWRSLCSRTLPTRPIRPRCGHRGVLEAIPGTRPDAVPRARTLFMKAGDQRLRGSGTASDRELCQEV